MKRMVWSVLMVAACGVDAPVTDDVTSASTIQQGREYQGREYQGREYQGTQYDGTDYRGNVFQGATYGKSPLYDGAVAATTLSVWRHPSLTVWEQRFPNKVCYWNYNRTLMSGCTMIDLATSPSPLAGARFPATFVKSDGTAVTGTVQIGASASSTGAVLHDSSEAMFPLKSSDANGAISHRSTCDHPDGCRVNSDLWLYDVRLVDSTGTLLSFCPAGASALALAGTWDKTGTFTSSQSAFTFACTTGTIAKCTRWGYRNWTSALRSDGVVAPLADYHQACVRAATADYCANGHSFTQNGTLVDISDYKTNGVGFVPSARSVYGTWITAFVYESTFDRVGGMELDHVRYAELTGTSSYGSLDDPTVGCPGTFFKSTDDVLKKYNRDPATWTQPQITVESTPACAHSERTIGKWLHEQCNIYCEYPVATQLPYCTDPNDSRGWDAGCVDAASQLCTGFMTPHSECVAGSALGKWSTGCTLRLCSDPAYASCCDTGWTSACVAQANAVCPGGQEHVGLLAQRYGFCNQLISPTTNSL